MRLFIHVFGKLFLREGLPVPHVEIVALRFEEGSPTLCKFDVVLYPKRRVPRRPRAVHTDIADEKLVVHSETEVVIGVPVKDEEGDPFSRERLRFGICRAVNHYRFECLEASGRRG